MYCQVTVYRSLLATKSVLCSSEILAIGLPGQEFPGLCAVDWCEVGKSVSGIVFATNCNSISMF